MSKWPLNSTFILHSRIQPGKRRGVRERRKRKKPSVCVSVLETLGSIRQVCCVGCFKTTGAKAAVRALIKMCQIAEASSDPAAETQRSKCLRMH